MRFRKALTLLMLAMGLVFTLSAWAQQEAFDAGPGARPAAGRQNPNLKRCRDGVSC